MAAADKTPGTLRMRSTILSNVKAGTGLTSQSPNPRYLPYGLIESLCANRKSNVNTFRGSAPRSFFWTRMKLLIINPAPISSTSARAI